MAIIILRFYQIVIDGMFVYAAILVILEDVKVGKLSLTEAYKQLWKPIAAIPG